MSLGIGMGEAEDAEQNRNIDMGELNELLGIWAHAPHDTNRYIADIFD